ncbi:MAG: hypothetical protein ACREUK_12165 [Burkholderiales bacterium]
MRSTKAGLVLAAVLCAVVSISPAYAYGGHGGWHGHAGWHGHGRVHLGLYFGAPLGWDPYYPYYYYPPVVAVPQSPPVYVEQGTPSAQSAQAPAEQGWWYFCRQSNAYYPYVKHCPGGWEKVSPQPPAR